MKKAKKIIIVIVSLLLIVGIGCFIYFNYLYDSNKLNIKEKEWINNNINKVVSFGIPANINNFSKNGSGVFYDFTSDLESEYKLNINDNTTLDEYKKRIEQIIENIKSCLEKYKNTVEIPIYKARRFRRWLKYILYKPRKCNKPS